MNPEENNNLGQGTPDPNSAGPVPPVDNSNNLNNVGGAENDIVTPEVNSGDESATALENAVNPPIEEAPAVANPDPATEQISSDAASVDASSDTSADASSDASADAPITAPAEANATEAPSLEQVAADLTNAAQAPVEQPVVEPATIEPTAEPTAEQPAMEQPMVEPATEPAAIEPTAEPAAEQPATEQPMVEPAAEPAAEQPTPSFGAVENPDLSDVTTGLTESNTSSDGASEMMNNNDTAAENPMEGTAENPTDGGEGATENSVDGQTENAPVDNESPEATSASFIGDAPQTAKKQEENKEDDEPLVPAEPVPGSIGSALVYSETAPGHSSPVEKPGKKKIMDFLKPKSDDNKSKLSTKTILIIVGAVVLIAIVVIIMLFIFGGGSNKSNTSTKNPSTPTPTQPVVSSLTCTREGDSVLFSNYANVESGKEEVIAMYTDDVLTSFGHNMAFVYEYPEQATAGLQAIRSAYVDTYTKAGFTSDPFESSYNANGTNLNVTHQADGEDIDSTNAKVLGLTVLKGEVYDDIDTLQEQYEGQGYSCIAK